MSQSNTNNPYAQIFGQFPQGDFSKWFTQGVPFDIKSIMETQQSNNKAFADALHALIQGVQDIARRQAELASEGAQEQAKLAKNAMGEGSAEEKIANNAEQIKKLYERTVSGVREISEMAGSVQSDVVDILNKRISASLGEIKNLAEKASKDKAATGSKKAAA